MDLNGRLIREQARKYPELVDDYDAEIKHLDILPVAFAERSWKWGDLEWIVDWKSRRAAGYFEDNNPEHGEDIVEQAIETRGVVEKVETLTELSGVGIPMASAFLVFMNPTAYTVLDIRAWDTLQATEHLDAELSDSPTVDEYITYLGVCHALANKVDVELRTLDRALWVIGGNGIP